MPKFEELTYYELLEIPINASAFEIRQAYKEALSIYGPESPISYSFFVEEERKQILNRIEDAFATLMDEDKRRAYDEQLVNEEKIDPAQLKQDKPKKPTPIFAAKSQDQTAITKIIKQKINTEQIQTLIDEILSAEMISGADLKRLRTAVGIKIRDVFEVTRITVPILEAIENEDTDTLPSGVYLKNFLRAYAELFKIDADKVTKGYLKHLDHMESPF